MNKKFISILTPVFNEWKNLTKLLARINIIFRKKLKKKFDLVVVNDCSTENFGCEGGWPDKAMLYVEKNGIDTEASYPYNGTDGPCLFNKSNVKKSSKS